MIESFNEFNKKQVTEQEEPQEINRLFGTGENPKRELILKLKSLVEMISKANPEDQAGYDQIKSDIDSAKTEIVSHPDFKEFKEEGFEWQDTKISIAEWQDDLKKAVRSLYAKATKKGLS